MPDLTSTAAVKAWLNVSGNSDDALLDLLVSRGSQFVRSYCTRDFLSQAYADTFDGKDTTRIAFPNYPVTAVASVTINGMVVPARSSPLALGYVFSSTMLSLTGFAFTRGFGNIVVAYTAGFAAVPADLEQACIELIAFKYRERDRIGHQSKTLGGETVAFYIGDVPKPVRTILDTYRKVVPA